MKACKKLLSLFLMVSVLFGGLPASSAINVQEIASVEEVSKTENIETNDKAINIAMALDNNYVFPTIVSITSMLENANASTFYKYNLLLSGDFAAEHRQKFLNLKKKYPNKCEFNFINMGNAYKENKEVGARITTPMYYRLSLPTLLKDCDRCLYLDGDTIIQKDLLELHKTNIDNYYIAGVNSAAGQNRGIKFAKILNLSDLKKYVNSGVLLMNLKKMREDKLEKRFKLFIENFVNKYKTIACPDQDTINSVCYDGIKILPFKYNCMTRYPIIEEKGYDNSHVVHSFYIFDEWEEGRKNPVIIHYADKIKPWNDKNSRLAEQWWRYAEKTDCFKEIQEKYLQNNRPLSKLKRAVKIADTANQIKPK